MKIRHKLAEQVIKERKEREAEELRQLRNLKRNLESGTVFDISDDLLNILLTYDVKDL